MIFTETNLNGAYVIELEKFEDERGFFARTWDREIFERHGLNSDIIQCSISFNKKKGTIRGIHYQNSPYEEDKLIRCVRGAAFEVIIDLRPESRTYLQFESLKMNSKDYKMLYVPKGFAFGFQTLEDDTELFYEISQIYTPEAAKGIPWNDEFFKIKWPLTPTVISKRDNSFEPFIQKSL